MVIFLSLIWHLEWHHYNVVFFLFKIGTKSLHFPAERFGTKVISLWDKKSFESCKNIDLFCLRSA